MTIASPTTERPRTPKVRCADCSYFKEQNRDQSGLCLIADHHRVMPWLDRGTCIVQGGAKSEGCDFGLLRAPATPPSLPPQGFVL